MIKRLALSLLLVVLYLLTFAVGSFTRPFGVVHSLGSQGLAVRLFIWDGALLMLGLFVVTLILEAVGRRLRDLAPWTAGSLAVAALLGYLLRLGFVTRDL